MSEKTSKHSDLGFSIVELMVAMLIGLIIISAVLTIYVSTIKNTRELLASSSLSQELTALMSILITDVRRSGYWSGIEFSQQAQKNPFHVLQKTTPHTNPVSYYMPYALRISKQQNCISFAYDADKDIGSKIKENALFAFRLKNKAIQTLQRVNLTNFIKNACADNAGRWMTITDTGLIQISDLHISSQGSQCFNISSAKTWAIATDSHQFPCMISGNNYKQGDRLIESRWLDIKITAHLAEDNKVLKQLRQKVRLRNDIMVVIP